MAESKYKYVLPNKVLEGKKWMETHKKSIYDIVKINVDKPTTSNSGDATYYQVHLMLPPTANAPADTTLEKYPLMFLHAAHQCRYGLKEVEKESKYIGRSIQFGPYSTYELTLKGGKEPTVQNYGTAKRWLAGVITEQLRAYIAKEAITSHNDIATGVRTSKEVAEKGKPKKKIPIDNVDEHNCSVEIPFARSSGGGRPSDDTPPSIKIGDAAKPLKSSDGSRSFDAPVIDGEKINYGNIHHFVLSGSKFMGIEDCGSISFTKVGYSWCHKWMDDIVIRKGSGNTRAVEYKGDLDDSAYAGMGGEEEPPTPAAAKPKAPKKKANPEDEIATDGGDDIIPESKLKTDALEEFEDEQEPPKPVAKAKAKAKAKAAPKPAAEATDDFEADPLEEAPKPAKPKAKAAPKPVADELDFGEEEEPPKPVAKAKAKAKAAPKPVADELDFGEEEETPKPVAKPKAKAKAKAPPKPVEETEDGNFE
jgi:hypothetical protein